jgi:transposase
MKSVVDILGGAQTLLDISFDLQSVFEEYLCNEHRAFLQMLRIVEDHMPKRERSSFGRGRPRVSDTPIRRAFLAKTFFRIEETTELISRLKSDSSLRHICGFESVPSGSTFSRRLSEYSRAHEMDQALNGIIREHREGAVVGHVSRDSTAIASREIPVNRKREVKKATPKRRRGRPRKYEKREKPPETRLQQQISQKPAKSIRELNRRCAWGCKTNSQGNASWWKGYKLHLDVDDFGIPLTAVVTGANVHDSQVAIPMEKKTGAVVERLYSLMDAAYDAKEIRAYVEATGGVALIDTNKRRGDAREPMDPAARSRFAIRTTVERANSHLKDWLLPGKILTKGHEKANFTIMSGVVCLAAIKILQHLILPTLAEAA